MTQPTIACYCLDLGMYSALYADGPDRDRRIAEFWIAHQGPGHLEERPPRDWYKKEAQLARLLRRLQREAAEVRAVQNVDSKGRV